MNGEQVEQEARRELTQDEVRGLVEAVRAGMAWDVALEDVLHLSTLLGAERFWPENLEAWKPSVLEWAAMGGIPQE